MRIAGVVLAAVSGLAAQAAAQGGHSIPVLAASAYTGGAKYGGVLAFDRALRQVAGVSLHDSLAGAYGATAGVALDAQRRLWIPLPSSPEIVRLDASGRSIDTLAAPWIASSLAASADGLVFALRPGGSFALDAEGAVLWSVGFPDLVFPNWTSGAKVCLTSTGRLWLGGTRMCSFVADEPVLLELAPADGAGLGVLPFPGSAPCVDSDVGQLAAAIDGSLWAWIRGSAATGNAPVLVRTDGAQVLQTLVHAGTSFGDYGHPYVRVDGQGRVLGNEYAACSGWDYVGCVGSTIRRHDPAAPSSPSVLAFGGNLHGFALGPTGEELFAVTTPSTTWAAQPSRLVRLNLVSGARSSVPLPDAWAMYGIPQGDPTGFVLANVVARGADFDGDGARNGDETAAGSDPFDAESRPDGPRVYVSFASPSNALVLDLVDPDGIRHPERGIDFTTMTVTVGASGNVFWALLGLVTEASISDDGTSAHAVFGGAPFADGLKLRVEASVRDHTGAAGWDWQATPPGEL